MTLIFWRGPGTRIGSFQHPRTVITHHASSRMVKDGLVRTAPGEQEGISHISASENVPWQQWYQDFLTISEPRKVHMFGKHRGFTVALSSFVIRALTAFGEADPRLPMAHYLICITLNRESLVNSQGIPCYASRWWSNHHLGWRGYLVPWTFHVWDVSLWKVKGYHLQPSSGSQT